MDKKTILWIVIGIMVIAVVFVTAKSLSIDTAGQIANSAGAAASSGGMVGGC